MDPQMKFTLCSVLKSKNISTAMFLFLAQRSLLRKSFLSIIHITMMVDGLSCKAEPQGCSLFAQLILEKLDSYIYNFLDIFFGDYVLKQQSCNNVLKIICPLKIMN